MFEIIIKEDNITKRRFIIEKDVDDKIYFVHELKKEYKPILREVGQFRHKEKEGLMKLISKAILRVWTKEGS